MRLLYITLLFIALELPQSFAQTGESEEKMELSVGGALRFNYNNSTWKPNQQKRGGDFGFEVFRINVEAEYKKVGLHIDQRFYAAGFGGAFLKYGWFQYELSKQSHLKLGLIPAYFGTQQFNSHSWFFQLPFYLGFEDDHDMGLSYSLDTDKLQLDVGFYKNAEELGFSDNAPVSDSRYSYDFSGRNKEINQLNLRFNYKFGHTAQHKLGATLQRGGIWNIDTKDVGSQFAVAGHYDLTINNWNFQLMAMHYNNQPENLAGQSRDWIEMTAYGFPYNTAAKANIYTINLAYTFSVDWGPISAVQVYNNYAYMDKAIDHWEDTQMNILGALISAGPVYIYVDYARGKHQPWLGPQWAEALTRGDVNNGWETRFNINFGYYY